MSQAPLQPADASVLPHFEPAHGLPHIDATGFREALAYAATAVTVIATDGPAGRAGVTCSAVCSVSDAPPTILFCVNRRSAANSVIKTNGLLSVNWLHARQAEVSQLFSGVGQVPMQERFDDARWQPSVQGIPYCTDALISLDCRIASALEIGTHSVFVAHVLNARRKNGVEPLVYCRRTYATTYPTQS